MAEQITASSLTAPATHDGLRARLAQALADELRRRRVTSLPLKGQLMRELGLDTLDQVGAWMEQVSRTFAETAEEFIGVQRAEASEEGGARDVDPLSCSVGNAEDAGFGLADSQPLVVNLVALAKDPKASLRAFGPEWAGRCAASALQALGADGPHAALNPVDPRGVDVGTANEWAQTPGAEQAQLVRLADVPQLVTRLLGTRRFASQDLLIYPYHQVESHYAASGRPGVTVSLNLRARHVGTEAQIELSINDHYSRSGRNSTANFSLQLRPAAARALALSICPELAVEQAAPLQNNGASSHV